MAAVANKVFGVAAKYFRKVQGDKLASFGEKLLFFGLSNSFLNKIFSLNQGLKYQDMLSEGDNETVRLAVSRLPAQEQEARYL